MGVGMPQSLNLHRFGAYLNAMFGEHTYHVGSSLEKKDGWRDVDVRVILEDEVWDAMKLGDPKNPHTNAKWVAYCLCLSAFGKELTGLPIDCQLQRQTEANEEFGRGKGTSRSFLGLIPELWAEYQKEMEEKTIPAIVEAIRQRQEAAAEFRGILDR